MQADQLDRMKAAIGLLADVVDHLHAAGNGALAGAADAILTAARKNVEALEIAAAIGPVHVTAKAVLRDPVVTVAPGLHGDIATMKPDAKS